MCRRRQQAALLVGMDVDVMAADMGAVYRVLTADSQLRWLGPEKASCTCRWPRC